MNCLASRLHVYGKRNFSQTSEKGLLINNALSALIRGMSLLIESCQFLAISSSSFMTIDFIVQMFSYCFCY